MRSTPPDLLRPDRGRLTGAIGGPWGSPGGYSDQNALSGGGHPGAAYRNWIARLADGVRSGETIFIDASDASLLLVEALANYAERNLTIVTNSLRITCEDLRLPATVLVCPGRLNQRTRATEGRLTVAFLRLQRLDTAFVHGSDSIATAVRAIAERTVDLRVRGSPR